MKLNRIQKLNTCFKIFFFYLAFIFYLSAEENKKEVEEKKFHLGFSFNFFSQGAEPKNKLQENNLFLFYKFSTYSFNFGLNSSSLKLENNFINPILIGLFYLSNQNNSPESQALRNTSLSLYLVNESNRIFKEKFNSIEFGLNKHFELNRFNLYLGLNYQIGSCPDSSCTIQAITPKLGAFFNFESAFLFLENKFPFMQVYSFSGDYSSNFIQLNFGAGLRF